MVYKFGVTTSENNIINIKHKDDEVTIDSISIYIVIRMTSRKIVSKRKLSIFAYQA